MKKNTLAHYERLKSSKLIEKVFSRDAKSIYEGVISIRYTFLENSDYPLKAGFSVSKRIYKKAHDRNKCKRWFREAYRVKKADLIDLLNQKELNIGLFIILQKQTEGKTFQDIDSSIEKLMNKLTDKIRNYEPKVV